jgi:TPR repeat protein
MNAHGPGRGAARALFRGLTKDKAGPPGSQLPGLPLPDIILFLPPASNSVARECAVKSRTVLALAAAAGLLAGGAALAQSMTPEPWTAEQSEKADVPAAQAGDLDAQISLARAYEARPAGDPKRSLAVEFWGAASVSGRPETLDALLRHARAGDVRAQVFLGRALLVRDTGKDRAAGLDWLRRAADARSVDASFMLGCLLGVSPNKAERAEAVVRLDRAAKADPKLAPWARLLSEQIGPRNVRAPWRLAPAARLRDEVQYRWPEAAQWQSARHWGLAKMSGEMAAVLTQTRASERLFELSEAAYAGDPTAQILVNWEVGRRCSWGKTLQRSACAAFQGTWPRNLNAPISGLYAGSKPVTRMLDVGLMFELGVNGPKDPATARAYYEKLQWSGNTKEELEAAWRLYGMEKGNVGRAGDPSKAEDYLRHAADGGHPMANYALGLDCEKRGLYKCAASRLRAAADGKIADAAYRYAELLVSGKAVVPDGPAHIFKYFRIAALAGDIRGFDGVARAYWNGWGVPKDDAKAEEWFQKGGRAGDPKAAWAAGNLAGRRGDWPGSIPWYRLAAKGGYPGAQDKLNRLAADGWRERSLGGFFMTMLDYAGAVAVGMEQAYQYQAALQDEQIRQSIMICQACSAGSGSAGGSSSSSSGSGGGSNGSGGSFGSSGAASDSSDSSGSSAGGSGRDSGGSGGGGGSESYSASGGGGGSGEHLWGDPAESSQSAWSAGGSGGGSSESSDSSSNSNSGGSQSHGAIIVDDGKAERARIAQREAEMQAEAARVKAQRDAENARLKAQSDREAAESEARRKAAYERYAIACYGSLEKAKTAKVSCE